MKPLLHATLVLLTLLATCKALADENQILHVMLQGDSAASMRSLAQAQSGKLTHYLPIINAVGAELTRAQLDAVLASGEVTRHIDDLALNDQPEGEPEPENPCKIAGSVEILRGHDGFRWYLYNKADDARQLTALDMSWPASLGAIQSITLAGNAVPPSSWHNQAAQEAQIKLPPEAAPDLRGRQALDVRFEHAAKTEPLQSDYSVVAHFGDDCETKLIPGYPENSTDFYYSTVTGAEELHRHGVKGDGVTVAVLDSGLWDHPALIRNTNGKDRVLARYDAINNSEIDGVFDESGHGTHLTSVIAHSGKTLRQGKATGGFKGIAPDVSLVAVKAFNETGQGGMLDIVRGLQWVVDNREKYNIGVLNLSFAARPRWPYYLDPINQAVMRVWAAGITVVAAAGNEGPEDMTVGSPGNLPYIITVGAVTDSWTVDTRADDYIPDFSSRGPTPAAHIKPDLVAPGGHITGITRPGSSLTQDHPEYALPGGDFVMTGSSQAAALVSGLAALLLQLEPDLSPDDVKCKLLSTAELAINRDGLLAYSPFVQGHGYVNLTRAITLGERGCGNTQLNLSRDMSFEEHFEGPAIIDADGKISLPGLVQMLSAEPTEKGNSENRVWGVKAHVERLPETYRSPANHPFSWQEMYELERQKIEALSTPP
jgi:hypothetical protein